MAILIPSGTQEEAERVPPELLEGRRRLTEAEIEILKENHNYSSDRSWQNVWVDAEEGGFCPERIRESVFSGFVVLGKIRRSILQYHDLKLETGIFRSSLRNVAVGDDCAISNVAYLENYRLERRVMLFNIQEMSCTRHSKFGEGVLKEGERESDRVWIAVGNENGGREILAFSDMIPADAFIWAKFRDDQELMQKFFEMTERGNDRKQNTFGVVGNDAVIKNTTLLKDAKIGSYAYIKGAFKLKNITILSSADEVSQVGEGVELVNGIVGYGTRVFYQAVAVRFVIGRNCQLKYGARLLNSVLGDNSTVSCCEILNNLIFPFHEQHHNSSFLIAATVGGQSNIASGATIGSNHNSRSPDGEIVAGRGFWSGLCSDFKHNSRFASFVLAAKGSYRNELNVRYPFSLVAPCQEDQTVHVIPAYWFLYNMFAIARNNSKFRKRDKRAVRIQHIETSPFAPDTMEEILWAVGRLIELTARYLKAADSVSRNEFAAANSKDALANFNLYAERAQGLDGAELLQLAKDFLHRNKGAKFVLRDDDCQKKYGALLFKPAQGYKEYRKVIKYSAVLFLSQWCQERGVSELDPQVLSEIQKIPAYTKWLNVGGQIIPEERLFGLFERIKSGEVQDWAQVHSFYDECWDSYCGWKASYAVYLLEQLYSRKIGEFTPDTYENVLDDVEEVSEYMYRSSVSSREKDYEDFFRQITYRNRKEMEAVVGRIEGNEFLTELGNETREFKERILRLFAPLVGGA